MVQEMPRRGGSMRRSIALLPVMCLSVGCAFGNVSLQLPTGPIGTGLSGGAGREIVLVTPFRDGRQIRDRCGMKKNGYNMDTASVLCSADPASWIANYLAAEFKAAGFSVK